MTARLYLEGNAELFAASPLAPPGPGWRLLRLQGKRQGAVYVVRRLLDGRWVCDCPDALYRRHECKHVLWCRETGLIAPE